MDKRGNSVSSGLIRHLQGILRKARISRSGKGWKPKRKDKKGILDFRDIDVQKYELRK